MLKRIFTGKNNSGFFYIFIKSKFLSFRSAILHVIRLFIIRVILYISEKFSDECIIIYLLQEQEEWLVLYAERCIQSGFSIDLIVSRNEKNGRSLADSCKAHGPRTLFSLIPPI